MRKFGFSISQTRSIDLDQIDFSCLDELREAVPTFMVCINCGACTATCSAQQFSDFNIRKIKTMLMQGQYEGLAKQLDKCMLCGKCTLVCPREVNLRNSIVNMRRILTKKNK
ncbi:MAG: 4Fe-4S dicluster domain-containing protein [Bacteroidales bacterium]|nr:4Fe-4S dicluster domain-containing protein [Bacteroidales bacterium]